MESCIRGFSYMPETKVDVMDLQFIEGGELERAWKTTRRQRIKQQEQKIWHEFVQEQDVIKSLCKDDPYQFLEHLPEAVLKKLMETELRKMQKETIETENNEIIQQGNGDNTVQENEDVQIVAYDEAPENEERNDIFHIFDDEKDDELSGEEAEPHNESYSSPCTVRENPNEELAEEQVSNTLVHTTTTDKVSSTKSSENVTNVIESSIYCAKVKDLRVKIDEQMLAILTWLERREVLNAEAEEVLRMCKRSPEFSNRFNRIYLYQLQRQMHDVKRHSSHVLPFAKHTQFQSQMVRIVSLHQNLYQAYQVFYKSLEQTSCLRESAECLRSLIQATRDAATVCSSAPTPKDFAAAANLYNDTVLISCDKLDEVLNEYSARMTEFLNITENNSFSTSRKSKSSGKRKWKTPTTKSGTEPEGRLSMYSLETLRLNLHPKSTSSKDNQSSGTSKMRGNISTVSSLVKKSGQTSEQAPKSNRKSPRCRRPLMRDPHAGRPRAPKPIKDIDVQTMVEAVGTCLSSHISREGSPRASPRAKALSPTKGAKQVAPKANPKENVTSGENSEITGLLVNRKSNTSTPRVRVRVGSPFKAKGTSLDNVKKSTNDEEISQIPTKPVPKTHSDDKEIVNNTPKETANLSPNYQEIAETSKFEKKNKTPNVSPGRCEVSLLLRQLCNADAVSSRNESKTGAKNAQLLCINGGSSPRPPSTPQLLKILEETIRKKTPKSLVQKQWVATDKDKFRLQFNISEKMADGLFQYRTKFVQHMLSSPMYANSAVGKPWEMIGSVSDQIIEELLLGCAKEMELGHVIDDMYRCESK